jgi:hypothetical protein
MENPTSSDCRGRGTLWLYMSSGHHFITSEICVQRSALEVAFVAFLATLPPRVLNVVIKLHFKDVYVVDAGNDKRPT